MFAEIEDELAVQDQQEILPRPHNGASAPLARRHIEKSWLYVVTHACSHRGVVNTIKQAQAASGVTKVHAVIGGFHLAPYAEDYVRQTIAALKDMDVDYVIPLHCSGEVFYDLAQSEIPTKLRYMGSRFVFQAA